MNGYWLLFASLSVIGSVVYNVTMKIGSTNTNAFIYAFMVAFFATLTAGVCLLSARYSFKVDVTQSLNVKTILLGLAAGASVSLIDIAYFYALRYGSLISSQMFWTIGSTLALTIVALVLFKEPASLTKCIGIVFGIISLILVTR